ncbi:MAG: PEP-CTERM sorting domain-containing protein [Planctomycetales bacterium]|nr:PEP-CTERM sorting domain-containing protein [Planctomycetales bacterium]
MKKFRWLKLATRAGALAVVLTLCARGFAADTVQDFSAIFPPPGVGGNAPSILPYSATAYSIAIIDGWDGNALRLTTEENSLTTGASFNQGVSGDWSQLQVDFDMSFSPGQGGGADGMSFVFVNTDTWGVDNNSPFPNWQLSEEPNLSGSFGIGFDTFNNADQGDNGESSVSVHFDNTRLDSVGLEGSDIDYGDGMLETGSPFHASITLTPAAGGSNLTVQLTNLDTGDFTLPYENYLIPGLSPYQGRAAFKARTGGANSEQSIDNLSIALTPSGGGAVQTWSEDFESYDVGDLTAPPVPDNPPLVGGTPYTEFQGGSDPHTLLRNSTNDGGAQPGYMQLTSNTAGQANSIAFDQTSDVADNINATFKFKIDDSGNNADGMSFLILDAGAYGDSGELGSGFSEEPNLPGVLSIGFDTFDNDEEFGDGDPTGCGTDIDGNAGPCSDRRANHFSLHWDGTQVLEDVLLDRADFDLVNNEWNEMSLVATEDGGDMLVTLVVTDGTDGSVHVIYNEERVSGASFPGGARAAFGGRTGDANSLQSIDDVHISWTGGGGLRGDFNNDGVLDASDIDDLTAQSAGGANLAAYDLTGDSLVNGDDVTEWIKADDIKKSWIGDANLDGEFNTSDLVVLFSGGKYETGDAADFTGDGLFTTSDLVAALSDGGYEAGTRAAIAAVPEPASATLMLLGGLFVVRRRRK